MRVKKSIRTPVLIGVLGAFTVVLGILENFIPTPIPAVRLGLANIPIMFMLYLSTVRSAFLLMIIKSVLVPVFSGSFIFKIILGFPSTFISFIVMVVVLKIFKSNITAISVGVASSFTHMFIQLLIANTLFINNILSTPIVGVLLLISVISGILTGVLTELILSNNSFKQLLIGSKD